MERYKSNKHAAALMPIAEVVVEAARVEGWRRRVVGSRGCPEAAGWRARTSGSIRAPGATQGEKQQSVSPFPPGKVAPATVRYYLSRAHPSQGFRREVQSDDDDEIRRRDFILREKFAKKEPPLRREAWYTRDCAAYDRERTEKSVGNPTQATTGSIGNARKERRHY